MCLQHPQLHALFLHTATVFYWLHALLLHTATVFYWVGAWNILAAMFYDKTGLARQDGIYERVLPVYFTVGISLCAMCGMLYSLGGVKGTYLPTTHYHLSGRRKRQLWWLRVIFGGMLGTMMVWVAVYSFISRYVAFESEGLFEYSGYDKTADVAAPPKYLRKDLLCIGYGIAMLAMTGTFFDAAQISVADVNHCCFCWMKRAPAVDPSPGSSCVVHAAQMARSLLALSAQISLWMG
jgi:hypothetical protein